jgi:hypothetical protein
MPAGCGVELNAIKPVLVADEIDAVFVGWMKDSQTLDDQPWYPQAQLAGQLIQWPAVRSEAIRILLLFMATSVPRAAACARRRSLRLAGNLSFGQRRDSGFALLMNRSSVRFRQAAPGQRPCLAIQPELGGRLGDKLSPYAPWRVGENAVHDFCTFEQDRVLALASST